MKKMQKINIAILGYGVVGSGVKTILDENQDLIRDRLRKIRGKEYSVVIKKILIRDIEKYDEDLQKIMTEDIEDIINDEEIDIVCELIGGDTIAVDYVMKAIGRKKHIVTANKKAIFTNNINILNRAKEKNVSFKYEAAVAGAIPIVRVIEDDLIGEEIVEVAGILNGSTNYIMTKIKEGMEYSNAMDLAFEKGYLEADPSSDVLGYDTMYKLGILGNLIYGEFPTEEEIERIGIDEIHKKDIEDANKFGKKIKLIGRIKRNEEGLKYTVKPELIGDDSPLYNIDGSLNGILLKCKNAGDIFLSGAGAGSKETAVSVVGDIISIAKNLGA